MSKLKTQNTAPMQPVTTENPVRITYFTDPFCIASYAAERHLERLAGTYKPFLSLQYRMGGLMPLWELYRNNGISTYADMARHWMNLGAIYELPITGGVWLSDPPHSSFPPSIAFKTAQLQDDAAAISFLKHMREMLFTENENITNWLHIKEAARRAGLSATSLYEERHSIGRGAFEQDLEVAEQYDIKAFPTFIFENRKGRSLVMEGYQPYASLEKALRRTGLSGDLL